MRKTGESIRGKEVDLFIERRRGSRKIKLAETNAWREEQPRERQEEEESSREDSLDSEETVGEVQWTEEERIARAIKGEGEFLSEELKKLLREIESAYNL